MIVSHYPMKQMLANLSEHIYNSLEGQHPGLWILWGLAAVTENSGRLKSENLGGYVRVTPSGTL